jgi:hypothetical protein
MSKKKYVIDDRKPSLIPKIGSAVIALGSFASVAAVASPNFLPIAQEAFATSEVDSFGIPVQGEANSQGSAETSPQTSPTLPSREAPEEAISTEPVSDEGSAVIQAQQVQSNTQVEATVAPVENSTAPATQEPVPVGPAQEPASDPAAESAQSIELPSIPAPDNVSSPTPGASGSGESWGSVGSSTPAAGNVSSPTPVGAGYDDDDEDYEDYDDHDHDDDHDDDDDDDHDDDDDDDHDDDHDDHDDDDDD